MQMPDVHSLQSRVEEARSWRHEFHRHPELLYDVHRTASRVAALLRGFGVDDCVTGLGRTGVVGVIRGRRGPGPVVALRAEMDALPIHEVSGLPYASLRDGVMHACGHDGHSAILLAASKYFSDTRDFHGTVVVVFQPAEEGGAGGKAMIEDGLLDRFGIEQVYGMHNLPGLPLGSFATRSGAMMAAVDEFDLVVHGKGGHAAWPHLTCDSLVAAAEIVISLQTAVARRIDPLDVAVLSITGISAGTAYNVIAPTARLCGTVRTLDDAVRNTMETSIRRIAGSVADAHGATVEIDYRRGYPATVTDPARTETVILAATAVAGAPNVESAMRPLMGGEDFAFMLGARAGGYVFVGNGQSSGLHTDTYDFSDDAIPYGIRYWIGLVMLTNGPAPG
ncbi:M20 family metallopeptidase [Acetobacteraceae bacterium KSS8]|uniref:M20 family metallopeptidase n=1 Tax=Endosaccharibacter trunci TaxID=2812733 RepID=A0ABT1W7Q8_9PROT|nr:M20 family metallopeptidase [Acetobacteraceae bacterium KSS8]